MPRFLFASFLVCSLAFAGCGSSEKPKIAEKTAETSENIDVDLAGSWEGKMIVNDAEAAQKLSDDQIAELKALRMKMTFQENGTLILNGNAGGTPYESQNRWEYLDQDNNKLTISSIDPEGEAKKVDLYFNDSNSFDMPLSTEVANLGAMRFTRVR